MSTDTRCSESRVQVSKPRLVLSTIVDVFTSRMSMSATPRVALPHVLSTEPFGFQNRRRAAASSQSNMTASWLNPMPRFRSPSRRATSLVIGSILPRMSMTTKSSPCACIFMKFVVIGSA